MHSSPALHVSQLTAKLLLGGLIAVICWMLQAIKDKKLVTARCVFFSQTFDFHAETGPSWIWYKVQWFFQDYTGCTSLINDLIETIGVRASYAHIVSDFNGRQILFKILFTGPLAERKCIALPRTKLAEPSVGGGLFEHRI
jgi:hypothetical protein